MLILLIICSDVYFSNYSSNKTASDHTLAAAFGSSCLFCSRILFFYCFSAQANRSFSEINIYIEKRIVHCFLKYTGNYERRHGNVIFVLGAFKRRECVGGNLCGALEGSLWRPSTLCRALLVSGFPQSILPRRTQSVSGKVSLLSTSTFALMWMNGSKAHRIPHVPPHESISGGPLGRHLRQAPRRHQARRLRRLL